MSDQDRNGPPWSKAVNDFVHSKDVYQFNSGIDSTAFYRLLNVITETRKNRPHVRAAVLLLTTYGGDADAAYKIAQVFRAKYDHLTIIVLGYCKSAGTLIVLGANEVAMSLSGELGPLDVQLRKKDELYGRNSGLNFAGALGLIRNLVIETYNTAFTRIVNMHGAALTLPKISEAATELAMGLQSDLASQIDPIELADVDRSIQIAKRYGALLCDDRVLVDKLITGFPSHSFVIDRSQAKELFANSKTVIREPDETEDELCTLLGSEMYYQNNHAIIRQLSPVDDSLYQEVQPGVSDDTANETARAPSNGKRTTRKQANA